MNEEEWHDCDIVGTIQVYHINEKHVNNFDDYDERMRGESQWKDLE